jgi:hypothetical protein
MKDNEYHNWREKRIGISQVFQPTPNKWICFWAFVCVIRNALLYLEIEIYADYNFD